MSTSTFSGTLDLVDRVPDQRERAEAQEVHLQQSDPLDLLHRPLRDDFVFLALVERYEFGERPWRDDDTRGVDRGVAGHAFETPGDGEKLLHTVVLLLHLLERRVLFQRLLERHVERGGDGLGDFVRVGVRDVHDAGDVTHHRARLHRSKRDDLRNVLASVLARDIVDDFAATALAEIDVDIRQRNALRVEEALEDQVVLDRIDIGDPQAVGHEAAGCRPTARPDGDSLLPCVSDEVPDDQEVPRYFICLIISTS